MEHYVDYSSCSFPLVHSRSFDFVYTSRRPIQITFSAVSCIIIAIRAVLLHAHIVLGE